MTRCNNCGTTSETMTSGDGCHNCSAGYMETVIWTTPNTNQPDNAIDGELDKLLWSYVKNYGNSLVDWQDPSRANEPKYDKQKLVPELLTIIKQWSAQEANKAIIDELEHILTHGSGGGSWRLIIKDRLAQLTEKIKQFNDGGSDNG